MILPSTERELLTAAVLPPSSVYRCPACGGRLERDGCALRCAADGVRVDPVDGILSFLTRDALARHEAFIDQYRALRAAEGRGADDPAHYLALPDVPPADARAHEWRLRRASMEWLRDELSRNGAGRTLDVLDAGAGNCWLTRWLAEWGHTAVALDMNVDARDGLVAGRHYLDRLPIRFDRVRADFEHLPFAGQSFDAVVFNGAFHYAQDMRAVLAEALRVLRPGGEIVIIDSPIYSDFLSGMKMLNERAEAGRAAFLTFSGLQLMADALGLCLHVEIERTPLFGRLKRVVKQWRMGREIATMGRVVLTPHARADR